MILSKLGRGLAIASALLAQACVGVVGEGEGNAEDALAPEAEAEPSAPDAIVKDKDAPEEPKSAEPPAEQPARSCADLTDHEVLAAIYGGPKVPPGYFSDMPSAGAWGVWGSGCGTDLDAVRADALVYAESSAGSLSGAERTTPLFHEVDIAISDGLYTIHYRKTRCDYFDGATLSSEPSAEALGELAVYLWYSKWAVTGGYHALLGSPGTGEGGELTFTLCEARATFGDCGLCDEIALLSSTYALRADGTVTLPAAPELVRPIKGQCDN